jgi:hypothetical protein
VGERERVAKKCIKMMKLTVPTIDGCHSSTSYIILFNIVVSKFSLYVDELNGGHKGPITDQ